MNRSRFRPNIDFLLTQKCNYCNYACPCCTKIGKKNEDAKNNVVNAFLKLAKTLDENWQITLLGGEPLMHPRFIEIIEKLRGLGLRVLIVTNFMAPIEEYKKIVDILGGHLTELTIEFHADEVRDTHSFLEKIKELDNYKNENTHLKVSSVLTEENAEQLKEIADGLNELGVTFQTEQLRVNNMLIDYSEETIALFEEYRAIIPDNIDTYGSLCHSGNKFLVIDTDGIAYRCYCSRYVKGHIVGNILDRDFELFEKGKACQLKDCVCPKPIEYGMLDRSKNSNVKVVFQTLANLISIPKMVVKNADISLKKYFT